MTLDQSGKITGILLLKDQHPLLAVPNLPPESKYKFSWCSDNNRDCPTISSYELFVHEPIRLADRSSFHPDSLTKLPNFDRGVAKSGVKGPLIVGSSFDKFWAVQSQLLVRAVTKND
jgi:hypothetical protein